MATSYASTKAAMKKLAASNNTLALKLHHSLHSDDAGNMIFSPLSISTALAMTYMGARGKTAKQMEEVMAIGPLGEDVHEVFKNHNSDLLGRVEDYILKIANRLYGQKKFQFQSEFLNATQDYYGAKIEALEFGSGSAREAINSWVEEQTEDRIKNLISPGVLTPDTRLVLVNAIYFKGEWVHPFGQGNTSDRPFHLTPSKEILVPTMFQTSHFEYKYDSSLECKILRMHYQKRKLRMVFVLPDPIDGLANLEMKLSSKVVQSWSRSMRSQKIRVILPKFKFTKSFSLAERLCGLGMTDLFSRTAADLTGISAKDKLFVSDVIHKAFLEVNEDGCEAAAATAVMASKAARGKPEPEPKEFKADHPFLFFIQSSESGAIVFMGRLTRPQSNESVVNEPEESELKPLKRMKFTYS